MWIWTKIWKIAKNTNEVKNKDKKKKLVRGLDGSEHKQ